MQAIRVRDRRNEADEAVAPILPPLGSFHCNFLILIRTTCRNGTGLLERKSTACG
jgi:hypothetical protein